MPPKKPNPAACAHQWEITRKGRRYCVLCHGTPCPGYDNPACPNLIPNGQKRCRTCRQRRKEVRRERKAAAPPPVFQPCLGWTSRYEERHQCPSGRKARAEGRCRDCQEKQRQQDQEPDLAGRLPRGCDFCGAADGFLYWEEMCRRCVKQLWGFRLYKAGDEITEARLNAELRQARAEFQDDPAGGLARWLLERERRRERNRRNRCRICQGNIADGAMERHIAAAHPEVPQLRLPTLR